MTSAHPILRLVPLIIGTLWLLGVVLQAAAVQAQVPPPITPTTGAGELGTTVTQVGTVFDIRGGAPKGSNLFHSFGLFSVPAGNTARFNNTTGTTITNILSRVTGGQTSQISGTIQANALSGFPAANFYLINPAGVVFGPTASLSVSGSFHVSTAAYVGFGNGEPKFFADPVEGELLSTAPPAAFGFLGPTAAPISIQPGGRLTLSASGQTLSLVGGDVQIAGSLPAMTLGASGGRIQIVSVGPPAPGPEGGLVTLGPDVNVSSFARLGQIDISKGARIDASGARGGTVLIRGGGLIVDNSSLLANTTGGLAGAAVGIDVKVEGDIVLRNPGSVAAQGSVATRAFSGGRAGNIEVEARNGDIRITGGATIGSDSFSFTTGQAGNVTLKATDAVVLSGTSSRIFSFSVFRGVAAGDILVDARSVTLMDRAQIESGRTGTQGGNVTVTAKDSIVIAGGSDITSRAFSRDVGFVEISVLDGTVIMDNGFINAITRNIGDAGRISVTARDVTLTGGSRINSSSELSATPGAGGEVTITGDSVNISGGSGLFSNAEGIGRGGNITVDGRDVRVQNGATISATSSRTGDAGNIALVIGDTLRMVGSEITTEALAAVGGNISITTTGSMLHLTDSRIATSVQGGVGRGGDITMGSTSHPVEFILLNNSPVRADAFGGPGGNISIAASVFLAGESPVTASSALSVSGTIDIQADVTDVSGSLAQLPEAILQAAALLRASCAARLAGGKTSTLVVAGREGLPLEPGGLLPSPLMAEGSPGGGPSRTAENQWERVAAEGYRLVAPSAVLDRWCSR